MIYFLIHFFIFHVLFFKNFRITASVSSFVYLHFLWRWFKSTLNVLLWCLASYNLWQFLIIFGSFFNQLVWWLRPNLFLTIKLVLYSFLPISNFIPETCLSIMFIRCHLTYFREGGRLEILIAVLSMTVTSRRTIF